MFARSNALRTAPRSISITEEYLSALGCQIVRVVSTFYSHTVIPHGGRGACDEWVFGRVGRKWW